MKISTSASGLKPSGPTVLIVMAVLFLITGLVASQNELLNPLFKSTFSLKHAESALIQFVYYGVFVLLAIPLGRMAERFGYRRCLQFGLFAASAGAMLFWFAAQAGMFGFFLVGLMIIATGVATLVILGNPYLTIISPPAKAAQRLNMVNGFYMVGTTLGPIAGNELYVAQVQSKGIEQIGLPYLILCGILLSLGFLIVLIHLPPAQASIPHEKSHQASSFSLWKDKRLMLGVLTMFVYVGAEIGAASKMVDWLMQADIMNLDQESAGSYLSIYWGLTMVMRFGAAILMHRIKAVYFLVFSAILGLLLVLYAVSGSGPPAGMALVVLGIANAVMFPTILALSTQHLGPNTQKGSSYIMMAICGGAIIPIVIGALVDWQGLRLGISFLLICYGIIALFGFRVMKAE